MASCNNLIHMCSATSGFSVRELRNNASKLQKVRIDEAPGFSSRLSQHNHITDEAYRHPTSGRELPILSPPLSLMTKMGYNTMGMCHYWIASRQIWLDHRSQLHNHLSGHREVCSSIPGIQSDVIEALGARTTGHFGITPLATTDMISLVNIRQIHTVRVSPHRSEFYPVRCFV